MAFNVLIVDDSLAMRSVLKKTIQMCGFKTGQILEAANGVEALKSLKENWVDLVLADYNMPQMDGLQLIEEMKKDELLSKIPVVMVTTEGSEKQVRAFLEKGAADYLQKPFTPEQIKTKLNRIMGEPEDGDESIEEGDDDLDF
ncbi:MAG: response regulator [Deltaproteobacteria bacterium]|nr:response regulator [Deltaproteobacteria bacterium]MBW2025060.1 response regulator [Deltaproteobacteria bacterium]MBW2125094.1 response regulator [Deltaproteobacteria bacterium]RLB22786.1 MAG: response regulator [Deltaproteobacteria bacterium]